MDDEQRKAAQRRAGDRSISLRQLDDEAVVLRVQGDYQIARGDKAKDFERCKEYLRIYQNLDPSDEVIDQSSGQIDDDERIYSNTSLPIGAALVESASAQIFNILFSGAQYFGMDAQHWKDEIAAAKITAHMLTQQKEMKYRFAVYEALQGSLCFDYWVTYMHWKVRPGYVMERQQSSDMMDYAGMQLPYQQTQMRRKWTPFAIDRPQLSSINFFNCAHDKGAQHGFDDSGFFIDWRNELIVDLMALAQSEQRPWGKYKNIEKAINDYAASAVVQNDVDDPADRGSGRMLNRLKIVRYWTPDHVVEIAGDWVISRKDLDGWPLQLWGTFPVPGEYRYMGLLERIERSALDVNAIINNRRQLQNWVADPMAIVSENLDSHDDDSPRTYPGKTFIAKGDKNPKDLAALVTPSIPADTGTEELGLQVEFMKLASGIGDNAMGKFSSGRRTAREANFVQSGTVSRAAVVAMNHETNALIPLYQEQFKLNQRLMTAEQIFKYMGPEGITWLTVRPEDYAFHAMPNFEPKGADFAMNIEMRVQLMLKGVELGMMMPEQHNMPNILASLWQMIDPKNWTKFVRDPREKLHNIPPEVENMMFAQGHTPEISPENDDREHSVSHKKEKQTADYQLWPTRYKLNFEEHIKAHDGKNADAAMLRRGTMNPMQDESDMMRGQHEAGGV